MTFWIITIALLALALVILLLPLLRATRTQQNDQRQQQNIQIARDCSRRNWRMGKSTRPTLTALTWICKTRSRWNSAVTRRWTSKRAASGWLH
jgi:cytochrome c-type biogenesis protein CcmH/NrfG